MFRKFVALLPALLVVCALAGDALANRRAISPQQKAAATKEYARRAKKQYGPDVKVKVTYSGPTRRDANIEVLGVGGPTGTVRNSLLAIGTGRVVVHKKPALVKKKGKVDGTLKGGRYQTIFSILPVPAAD